MSRHGSAVCVVHSRSPDGRHFLVEARRWPARWNVGHICLIQLAFFRSLLEILLSGAARMFAEARVS